MKRQLLVISMMMVSSVFADTLTLRNGVSVRGSFQGFSNRKFQFKMANGFMRAEYAVDVQDITMEGPVRVAVKTVTQQYDSAVLSQIDHNLLRLRKDGQVLNEPVMMLKRLNVMGPAVPDTGITDTDAAGIPRLVESEEPPVTREWQRTGKWREISDDKSMVISHGEEVDVAASLKRGLVNVVHFHYPQSMASVREGSYIQAMAAKHNRMVILKVICPDFNTPVCRALNLKSLPQFWFYSPTGRLVKKLADRFTESDIDAALREASRN